jgi:hypothetical protein
MRQKKPSVEVIRLIADNLLDIPNSVIPPVGSQKRSCCTQGRPINDVIHGWLP